MSPLGSTSAMFHPTVPHTCDFLSHFVPPWQGKKRHRRVFFSVLHISLIGLSRRVESAAKTTSTVMGFLPTRSRYSCGERAEGAREAEKLEPNGDPKPLARGQRRCAHAGRISPRRFCAGLMSPRAKTLGPRARSFTLGSRIRPLRISARRDSRCVVRGLRRRRQRSP